MGSVINYANLARDLQVSPPTVKKWVEILEDLYVVFVVRPYAKNFSKALLKGPKVYFYDIGRVPDSAARLENLVAYHLLKRNYFLQDTKGIDAQLYFYRDKEKREVDFVLTNANKITHAIEVKTSDNNLSPSLNYFTERTATAESLQLVYQLKRERHLGENRIVELADFLATLET